MDRRIPQLARDPTRRKIRERERGGEKKRGRFKTKSGVTRRGRGGEWMSLKRDSRHISENGASSIPSKVRMRARTRLRRGRGRSRWRIKRDSRGRQPLVLSKRKFGKTTNCRTREFLAVQERILEFSQNLESPRRRCISLGIYESEKPEILSFPASKTDRREMWPRGTKARGRK